MIPEYSSDIGAEPEPRLKVGNHPYYASNVN